MAIRDVLAKIGGTKAYEAPIPELSFPSPTIDPEILADLELEERLFCLYWRTLPDKALARRTWPSEFRWYCLQKQLDQGMMEALEERCLKLLEENLEET